MTDAEQYEFWREYPEHDPQSMVWYPLSFGPIETDQIWPEHAEFSKPVTSLYIHVPFCKVVCPFCPFNKYVWREQQSRDFIAAVLREIEVLGRRPYWEGTDVRAVYFGGGTGTSLSGAQLNSILQKCKETLHFTESTEVTVEGSPETITLEKLKVLMDAGVTRISFGVQTWNDRYLKMLGRGHNAQKARSTLDLVRKVGFGEVAIDLMYRLPGQTQSEWQSDLEESLRLGIDHISAYSLFVEPGAPLARVRRRGKLLSQAEEAADLEMFGLAIDLLGDAGLELYTLYDFAPPSKRCDHHLVNWAAPQGEYVGLGPGAFSFVRNGEDEYVYGNLNPLDKYFDALDNWELPIEFGNALPLNERMARYLVLGVNALSIPKQPFASRFGVTIDEVYGQTLTKLEDWGLMVNAEDSLDLTRKGKLYISNVGKAFATRQNATLPHPAGVDLQRGAGESLIGVRLPD